MSAEWLVPLLMAGAVGAHLLRSRPLAPTVTGLATLAVAAVIVTVTPTGWSTVVLGDELTLTPLSRLLLVTSIMASFLVTCLAFAFHDEGNELLALSVTLAASIASFSSSEPLVPAFGLGLAYLLLLFVVGNSVETKAEKQDLAPYLIAASVALVSLVLGFTLIQSFTVTREASLERFIVPLLGIGFAVFLGAFPFHLWMPAIFDRASPLTMGLLVGVVFPQTLGMLVQAAGRYPWLLLSGRGNTLLLVGGVAGALGGAGLALVQPQLRRTVAYLVVANAGFALAGLAVSSATAAEASVWIVLTQALAIVPILVSLQFLRLKQLGHTSIRRIPLAFPLVVMCAGSLGLVGVPPLAGFPGRWLLVEAVAAGEPATMVALLLANTMQAAAVIRAAWQLGHEWATENGSSEFATATDPKRSLLAAVVTGAALALVVAVGLFPAPLAAIVSTAVGGLALVF